jgi:hypothetical protein
LNLSTRKSVVQVQNLSPDSAYVRGLVVSRSGQCGRILTHKSETQLSIVMPFRIMGPHERGRFAPEAWGHLMSLSGSGIINGAELEHIIERALIHFEGRIALDDIRHLMENAGLDDLADGRDSGQVH